MSGLAIPFSMWQCAGHGDAAGPPLICARHGAPERQEHRRGTGWRSTTTCRFTASSAKACAMSRCTARPLALTGSPARSSWPHAIAGSAGRRSSSSGACIDRQQLALCHPDAWPGAQLGLAGAGAEPAAAVAGHPHGYPVFLAETFVDVSRFVGTATARRTGARLTRGCPRARRLGALAPPRPAQGDLRVRTDRRRRRGAEPDRGAGTLER